MVLLRQALLVGAIAMLGLGGLRLATGLSDRLLERLVAAATLAATAMVLETLTLGLFGLGSSPVALVCAAILTCAVARACAAPPRVTVSQQLTDAWADAHPAARLAAGAVVGGVVAWTVWLLRFPAYDFDSLSYHIPEVASWVHNGAPGSIVAVVPGWPYAYLPVTNEVILTWGTGIARSFVWISVWPALLFSLLAGSGWLVLRSLRVDRLPAALATIGLCAAPMATSYMDNGANTDFPALVWLVVAGALSACAIVGRQPRLLIAAVLAAGLSIGTKPTTLPALAILAVAVCLNARDPAEIPRWPLALAAVAALVAGGSWYLRDLAAHGSPTWPYFTAPWGDPAPHIVASHTFWQRPLATLGRFGDAGYVKDTFVGGLLLLVAALPASLWARSRWIAIACGTALITAIIWAAGPDTGAPTAALDYTPAFDGSLRLLMPAVAVATLTVALASRVRRRSAWLWTLLLAGVAAVNLWQLFRLGFPHVPGVGTPLAGGAIGAAAAGFVIWMPKPRLLRAPLATAVTLVAIAAAAAVAAPGMVDRYASVAPAQSGLIRWFEAHDDNHRIYSAPFTLVTLSGPDLARTVDVIPRRAPCTAIAALARRDWVVIENIDTDPLFGPSTTRSCVARWRPVFVFNGNRVFDRSSIAS